MKFILRKQEADSRLPTLNHRAVPSMTQENLRLLNKFDKNEDDAFDSASEAADSEWENEAECTKPGRQADSSDAQFEYNGKTVKNIGEKKCRQDDTRYHRQVYTKPSTEVLIRPYQDRNIRKRNDRPVQKIRVKQRAKFSTQSHPNRVSSPIRTPLPPQANMSQSIHTLPNPRGIIGLHEDPDDQFNALYRKPRTIREHRAEAEKSETMISADGGKFIPVNEKRAVLFRRHPKHRHQDPSCGTSQVGMGPEWPDEDDDGKGDEDDEDVVQEGWLRLWIVVRWAVVLRWIRWVVRVLVK